MRCVVCRKTIAQAMWIDKHHIKTRKSGGTDDDWNLIELCRNHHEEIHKIGTCTFIEKYDLQDIFKSKGWEIEKIFSRKRLVQREH